MQGVSNQRKTTRQDAADHLRDDQNQICKNGNTDALIALFSVNSVVVGHRVVSYNQVLVAACTTVLRCLL